MDSQKTKIDNNIKNNMLDKPEKNKTKEQCPRENKDCENCDILSCPEEKT